MQISIETQEYFGWAGNAIFITAQLFQIIHTYKIKTTRDISYGLQLLFFIGDLMFTIFGALDNSLSMFIGNGVSTLFCIVQIAQKVFYDHYYKKNIYETNEGSPLFPPVRINDKIFNP